MRNKKYLFFGLIIVSCICFCSCDAFLENLEKGMLDWLNENVDYSYKILVNFENIEDKTALEMRIKSLGFDILKCDIEDNNYTYELLSHFPIDDQTLYMVCENPSVLVVDGDENIILKRSDVISINLDLTSSACVVVSNEFCEEFYNNYIARTIKFVVDDNIYDIDAITDETDGQKLIIFLTNDETTKTGIKQMVIAFSSEPLKGKVKLIIEKSATRA